MTDQAPTVFGGRYELHRRIARGGMAEVFLARDQLLDRPVAVKVLFAEFATDPTFVERFRREAKAAANLNHPNIVGIFDWGEEDGTYYIVMEYVEGRSLAQTLSERGKLDPKRAADIASEVAAALGHAHDRGVAHRDVKPGNVLISNKGEVKVADFGIATAMTGGAAESNLTQTGSVMGTATYFSPEQAQGKAVDPRSDLYSLGVVMYEMLVGKPPFTAETPVAIAYKHVQELPLSPRDQGVEVPVSLAAITMKLLAKNPENRYPTAVDLRADIGRYRSGAQIANDTAPIAGPTAVQPALGMAGAAAGAVAPNANPMAPNAMPPTAMQPGVPQGMPAGMAPTQVNPGYAPTQMQPGAHTPPSGYGPPPRNRPGFGALAFALILAGLAALAVLLVVYFNGRVEEPPVDEPAPIANVPLESVFGLDEDAARRVLETQGLVPDFVREYNEDVPAGEVTRQDPSASTSLAKGDTVTVYVSDGPAPLTVPQVVGIQSADAQRSIRDVGFEVEVTELESDDELEGNVISQDPPADELRPPGSTVVITVSVGPLSIPIPDVAGQPQSDAASVMRDAGFEVQISPQADEDVPAGVVIESIPAAEEKLKPGEQVELIVSVGPPTITVPTVQGLMEDAAAAELDAAGFAVTFGQQTTLDPNLGGLVLNQDPAGNTELLAGESVIIYVGVYTPPLPTVTPVPLPTVTPVPLPTATPVPVQVPPTATAVPPTATLVPATAVPTNTPAVITPTPAPAG